ncbi:MAG: mechanosensitive ion channel [Deltaproteobacteria bacterium]|nr:mechanosensitive ion channel [Deltaproteobacteria bacterium]
MQDAVKVFEFIRLGGLVTAFFMLVGVWIAGKLLAKFLVRLGERFNDRRLQIQQIGTFVRFMLYIGGFIGAVLVSFHLSEEMIFALGGTIAVTVGFAFKDLAASMIAGLTILIDRPFQVGDRVSFDGYYGEITTIGLRSVRLTTLDDNLVTIPNNKFLVEAVSSGNAGELNMLVQTDFFIGIDQDIARAKHIVADAITTSRYAYLQKPWVVLTSQLVHQNYFAIRLRAKVYVNDVVYEKALETDVTERVLEGFRRSNICPPAILYRPLGAADEGPKSVGESERSVIAMPR